MKSSTIFLKYIGIFLILICGIPAKAQVYLSDGEDLEDSVNVASPGDVFIVLDGTYTDFESVLAGHGDSLNPIIVKAETIGGVILKGDSHINFKKASHIVLEGFVFDAQGDNTLVKLEASHHIRITRNVFELQTIDPVKWVYVGGIWNDNTFQFESHHNRIDHNTFQNKDTPGHYITIDGTNDGNSDFRQSKYDRIDHNHFKNNSPRAINEQESIRIGWSEMSTSSGYTVVEHNLFEDCDGDPEVVSVKSCDNIIRHNTFKGCYGTLSLRHGNRNHVEGNFFFGNGKPNGTYTNSSGGTSTTYTGGIRIYGTDHVIINNYMEGLKGTKWDAPITLTQGDAIDGSSTNWSKHFRAERVTIAYNTLVNNTYGIEIGFDNNNNYNKSLKDITIANNIVTGSENSLIAYIDGNKQTGEIDWSNNVFYATGTAQVTSDNSTFTASEAQITDPFLVNNTTVWNSSVTTPSAANTIPGLVVSTDFEGQPRQSTSTIGADHFSSAPVIYGPLSASDVGPNAYSSLSTPKLHTYALKIYPTPTSGRLIIEDLTSDIQSIQVFTAMGQMVLHEDLENKFEPKIELNLNHLSNGYYIIKVSGMKGQFSQKIKVEK
jgi:hypothetical protein